MLIISFFCPYQMISFIVMRLVSRQKTKPKHDMKWKTEIRDNCVYTTQCTGEIGWDLQGNALKLRNAISLITNHMRMEF